MMLLMLMMMMMMMMMMMTMMMTMTIVSRSSLCQSAFLRINPHYFVFIVVYSPQVVPDNLIAIYKGFYVDFCGLDFV